MKAMITRTLQNIGLLLFSDWLCHFGWYLKSDLLVSVCCPDRRSKVKLDLKGHSDPGMTLLMKYSSAPVCLIALWILFAFLANISACCYGKSSSTAGETLSGYITKLSWSYLHPFVQTEAVMLRLCSISRINLINLTERLQFTGVHLFSFSQLILFQQHWCINLAVLVFF